MCNDTDMFVLLCHFKHALNINANIFMVPLTQKMKPVDNGQTVVHDNATIPHLMSLHAITSCDIVSKPHSIGKTTALKSLEKGHAPQALGGPYGID